MLALVSIVLMSQETIFVVAYWAMYVVNFCKKDGVFICMQGFCNDKRFK